MNSLEYPITGSNKNQRLNEEESRSEDIEDEEKGYQQVLIPAWVPPTQLSLARIPAIAGQCVLIHQKFRISFLVLVFFSDCYCLSIVW